MGNDKSRLESENRKLITTLKLAGINSWEWDLQTRNLYLINASGAEVMGQISPLMAAETAVVPNYPDILLQKGIIEGSAIEMVSSYTRLIYMAAHDQEVSFRIPFRTMQSRAIVWIQFVGIVKRDREGNPDRAIGYYMDVTAQMTGAGKTFSVEEMMKVEREKQNYIMMINGLTAEYANVFFIDLNADTYTPFRMNEVTKKLIENQIYSTFSFRQIMSYYIDHYVIEDDRDMLRDILEPDKVREYLKDNNYININYRSERLGEIVYCQVKLACGKEEQPDNIVLGIRNIDEEYRTRQTLILESRTDSLTGLLNKKAMWEDVKQLLMSNGKNDVVFMFMDLDHFKDVNDTLGHAVGDQALKDAAAVLRKVFRRSDVIGRFGGDEFCVFLPDIPKGVAMQRVEQCLQGLRKTYSDGEHDVNVTASIGMVHYMGYNEINVQELMLKADEALYRSKHEGRDRYTIINLPE